MNVARFLIKLSALVLGAVVLIVLPACIKTYKLVPTETPQGKERETRSDIIKNNIRSVSIYDQFATEAAFDVLRCSDEIRVVYACLHCARRGKDVSSRNILLKQLLEENRKHISFYVLADVRDKKHTSLSDDNAAWTMYLETKDKEKILPSSIEEVELDPEVQDMFGYRFSKFKVPYLVKFPVDENDLPTMIISSVSKYCKLYWDKKKNVKVTSNKTFKKRESDEDFYWL